MKARLLFAACALAVLAGPAAAQFLGDSGADVVEPRMIGKFWASKPTIMSPYVAPNRPHWKLSEILLAHKGESDWIQPIIRNKDQVADYISMSPGARTKLMMWPDDRIIFIVWGGSLKVSIEGYPAFVATKGFMVNVPYRHMYTLESVGTEPALRFEVRQNGATPIYPADVKPDPIPGRKYVLVTERPGQPKIEPTNPIYLDYMKVFNGTNKAYGGKFVRDDHFLCNILRGKGEPVPPDSDKGHFHIGWNEFWFVMEGRIGLKLEGEKYFTAEPGDVLLATEGRFHRLGDDPSAPWSTRVPINPRPPILHNFEAKDD